jgi:hypothetical protein
MSSPLVLSRLRIADFVFAPESDVRLQPYSGSVWRGAFGFTLKRLVCVMRMRPCTGCPLAAVCVFPRFFGGDRDHDEPRPYVLALLWQMMAKEVAAAVWAFGGRCATEGGDDGGADGG